MMPTHTVVVVGGIVTGRQIDSNRVVDDRHRYLTKITHIDTIIVDYCCIRIAQHPLIESFVETQISSQYHKHAMLH
jgi:phage gp36-like protein